MRQAQSNPVRCAAAIESRGKTMKSCTIGRNWFCITLTFAAALLGGSCNRDSSSSSSGTGSKSEAAGDVKIFKASPGSLKLAFVTNNTSEFWKIAAAGVHKYEKEANIQVDIKMPPNGKTEEQNSTLENLVSQGYNGIADSVI